MRLEEITEEEFNDMCSLETDNYFQNGCVFDDYDNLMAFTEYGEVGNTYYRIVRD